MRVVHVRRTVLTCYKKILGQILRSTNAQSTASLLDLYDEGFDSWFPRKLCTCAQGGNPHNQ